MNIQQFWSDVLAQRADEIREYFQADAYVNWHCSNEHFTVEEFIRANCEYPGDWDGEVQIRPYVSVDEAKAVGHIGYAVRHSMWGKSFPCDTIMTKPHSTVLDKNWLAWKEKSERNG